MHLHPACDKGFQDELEKLALPWGELFNAGMRGAGRLAGNIGSRLAPAMNVAKGVGQEFAASYPRASKALRWAGGQALQGAGFSAAMAPFARRQQVTQVLPDDQQKTGQAYQETMELLFKEAEAKGFSDPHLSPERRAWYLDFEKQAGPEALEILDEEILSGLPLHMKVAHYAGLGKVAGLLSPALAAGAKAVAEGPSKGLMAAFLKRSPQLGEGGVKKLLGDRAQMVAKEGPAAWTRLRRTMGTPGSGPLAMPHPAGTGGTLGSLAKKFAPAHSLRREFATGAAFGGGFGMLERMTSPKEESEVQIGKS